MKHILLLKEELPRDAYRTTLEHAGYRVSFLSPISYTYPLPSNLEEALGHPERYSGLIFTSPRAIDVFLARVRKQEDWLDGWRKKPVYVVGERSALPLQKEGFKTRTGRGTARSLAETIVATHRPLEAPLLFLAGNLRRSELPGALRTHDIPFEEITVYETHIRTDLPRPNPLPDWMVFFSPSGVEAAWRSFGHLSTSLLALGPTTAAALREKGVKPDAVASSPTPEGILRALQS